MTGKSIDYADILNRFKCDREQAANDLERLLLRDELPSTGAVALAIVTLRSDLQPVVHAHWIRYDDTDGWNCSACGCDICGYDDNPAEYGVNFCERCSAKMDEEVL